MSVRPSNVSSPDSFRDPNGIVLSCGKPTLKIVRKISLFIGVVSSVPLGMLVCFERDSSIFLILFGVLNDRCN
jgi:hypothetical protein